MTSPVDSKSLLFIVERHTVRACTPKAPNLSTSRCVHFAQSQEPLEYLRENVARVKDVELLTGLTFFSKIEASSRVILSTFLPEALWPTQSWMDAGDDNECPVLNAAECPAG